VEEAPSRCGQAGKRDIRAPAEPAGPAGVGGNKRYREEDSLKHSFKALFFVAVVSQRNEIY